MTDPPSLSDDRRALEYLTGVSKDDPMQVVVDSLRKSLASIDMDKIPAKEAISWLLPVVATLVNTQLDIIQAIARDEDETKRLVRSASLTTQAIAALSEAIERKRDG